MTPIKTKAGDIYLKIIPVASTGLYLSRTGLIWWPTEDQSPDKQERDYFFTRDKHVLLGEITHDLKRNI